MKRRVIGAVAALFAVTLVACAAADWHSPHAAVLVAIFAVGLGLGAWLARARFRERAKVFSFFRVFEVYSAGRHSLLMATLLATGTAAAGAGLTILLINDWRSRVIASLVAAAYTATLPLHPIVIHALLTTELIIGYAAMELSTPFGSRHVLLRDVLFARTDAQGLLLGIRRDRAPLHFPMSAEAAAKISGLLVERTKPVPVPVMLARGGRSIDEWRRDLSAPDYRTVSVDVEELVSVLIAGPTSLEERVGAALMLAALGEHERVKEAAYSMVHYDAANALHAIASQHVDDAWLMRRLTSAS